MCCVKRLLSLCGSAAPVSVHIAQHTVRTLLAAVNFIELPPLPAGGRKLISEQSAIQINSLVRSIIYFTTKKKQAFTFFC